MKQYTLANGVEQLKAIATSGIMIKVESDVFSSILSKSESPIVVVSHKRGLLSEFHQYLAFYKGLTFFAESKKNIVLPQDVEIIEANRIWTPY